MLLKIRACEDFRKAVDLGCLEYMELIKTYCNDK